MHKTELLSLGITQWFEGSRLTHSKQLEIDYSREAIKDSLFRYMDWLASLAGTVQHRRKPRSWWGWLEVASEARTAFNNKNQIKRWENSWHRTLTNQVVFLSLPLKEC